MAVHSSTPRKLFTPTPTGLHPAVIVDIYYRYDIPDTYKKISTVKDRCWIVWQFDRSLGTTKWQGKEVSYWQTLRFNVTPIRYTGEGENREVVDNKQYKADVMRDPSNIIPVTYDDDGDLDMFLGERHTLYKEFAGWGGEDFKKAVKDQVFSIEKLIASHAQFQILVAHSAPDDDGQVWPRAQALSAPLEGQKVEPVDYERMKDRQPDDSDEALPF